MSEAIEAWVGRTLVEKSNVDSEILLRFAAAMGADLDVQAHFPPMGHWALFNHVVGPDKIGPDGHPQRGIFLPPIELPRRMFASSVLTFHSPIEVGKPAELAATVTDLRRRSGRSGELILMDQERKLTQGGHLRLTEVQTIAYREAGDPTPAVVDNGTAGDGELWLPNRVDLFRFSAGTYNSHRIHYDQAYAQQEEGYPDILVHGPFTAAKLCGLAQGLAGKPLTSFSFRAMSPLFVDQPIRLRAGEEPNSVVAVRCDGAVAMSATYEA